MIAQLFRPKKLTFWNLYTKLCGSTNKKARRKIAAGFLVLVQVVFTTLRDIFCTPFPS